MLAARMPRMPGRRTLARYAAVAAIVLVVGGLFVYQQRSSGSGTPRSAPGEAGLAARPAVGERAPDFELQEVGNGRFVHLSDFRGKIVVLNFWATWCPPCREEMPALQRTFSERQAQGDLVVIGVDYEEPDRLVADFVRDFGLTFPILMDRDGKVRLRYGVTGLPTTFFIDREGVVRGQSLGPVLGEVLPEGIRAAEQGAAASGSR